VEVAPEWTARLHEMRDDEEDMLDSLPIVTDYSRLSCQIIYEEELDGLELRLTDASLPDTMPSGASSNIKAEATA
jgi:2Fe-2S ferredoxin